MIDGLDNLLEGSGHLGLAELRKRVEELLGGRTAKGRLSDVQNLQPRIARVYRLRVSIEGKTRSLVIKRLDPAIAQRNHLVMTRWLPAIGLKESGPSLLDAVAERNGRCVWHIYQDLGDWALKASEPEPERVKVAVELIARIHTRFAGHPLLPECRLHGGDLGIYFYTSSVCDAIRGLEALRASEIKLSSERLALRDRLLKRLRRLREEQPRRARALAELGGPDTLLHGDLWTTNAFVLPTGNGLQARLIDWDHAALGPVSYDLSTFLLRFPESHRLWILDLYRQAVAQAGWKLPATRELNLLFETAEYARFSNCLIWPAIALVQDDSQWGFESLAEVERWFEALHPVLPEQRPRGVLRPLKAALSFRKSAPSRHDH